ncbi:T9SS type A sorting domain-containing protein, partial [Apibacter adventoris]
CNSINGSTLEVGSSSNKTLQLKYTVIGNPINFTGYKKTEKGITIEVGTEGQQISLSGSGVIAVTISGTPTQSGSLSLEINNRSCNLSIENKQIKKNELKLVPNPLNTSVGSIYINSDFEDNHATITIFDVSGKIIYINNYIVKKGEQKLEFKSPVLSGIYIVQFKSSKITKTLKLIVE